MQMNRVTFAAAMAKRNMTIMQLAAAANVSRGTINIVKGGGSCSPEMGAKIAAALQIPLETLTNEKGVI